MDCQRLKRRFGCAGCVVCVLAQTDKREEMRVDEEWLSKRKEGVSKNYIEFPKNVRSQKKEESRV
jgi:NADPH-dependent glutamate synthase beta subunit-like oxidoreductase